MRQGVIFSFLLCCVGHSAWAGSWLGFIGEHFYKQKLSYLSVNPASISNSVCLQTEGPDDEAYQEMVESLSPYPRSKQYIRGYVLEDESEALGGWLRQLLKGSPYGGSGSSGSSCSSALCVAKAVFGSRQGPKLLYLMGRYGINASHFAKPSAALPNVNSIVAWSSDELDLVLELLAELPSHMFPLGEGFSLHRLKAGAKTKVRGYTDQVTRSIVIFPGWDFLVAAQKKAVLLHEIAHAIGFYTGLSSHKVFTEISGWTLGYKGDDKYQNYQHFVSQYAFTDAQEDFAETLTAYRYNPNLLATVSPQKYRLMKEVVFNGLEYDKEKNCQADQAYYFLDIEVPVDISAYEVCEREMARYLVLQKNWNELKSCVAQVASDASEVSLSEVLQGHPYKALMLKLQEEKSFPRLRRLNFSEESLEALVSELLRQFQGT